LATRGHDVHVYTTNVDGPGVSEVELERPVDVDGVKVWYFPTGLGRRLYRAPAMGAALERSVASFDVAHLHSVFLWPTTAAARLARKRGVPYVLSPRGMLVGDLIRSKSCWLKSAWIAAFDRANVAGAASIHLTADIEAEELHRLNFNARRIDVVPNGVDVPDEPAADGSTQPRDAVRPRVLSLGRISWKKGLDRLIAAMAYVPDAELVIAGNDDEGLTPRLEQFAAEAGVRDRTSFVGPVRDAQKWALIRSCDVFVTPSLSENFGIATLEAMAIGRAVVVTPEVGLAQTIAETGAGVVAEGDPNALGEAIRGLLCDDERCRAMGAAGCRAATMRFSWPAIAEKMESVYRECLR
jgi:glycosyltransferase involved in cell wall biosynthesis